MLSWLKRVVERDRHDNGGVMFKLNDLIKLYKLIIDQGCIACTADSFQHDVSNGNATGKFLIKHDIHHDLDKTIELACREFSLGIRAVYFALPNHSLSKKYFGSQYMWNIFERIVSMGHEVGLHLDLHDLILNHGDLMVGIKYNIDLFTEHGIMIRSANLHGNTAHRKLYGSPKAFIRKLDSDQKPLRHIFPISDKNFLKFQASLSLEALAREYGILNWIDSEFFREGKRINIPSNCTDNSGSFRVGHNHKNILRTEPFKIDDDFCAKLASHCKESTTLFLIHPQYYGE